MAIIDSEAIVLRGVRYGESDLILALLTPGMGRVSAIAKGARKPTSRQGGRLQPGVRLRASLAEGRGDLMTLRSTQVVDASAGLWVDGYRLRAAGCVLEAALRVVPEHEDAEAAFNLITRALALIAVTPARDEPPRLDPYVLGTQAKLLASSGLVPHLASCAACGAPPPLAGFSASAGGAVCPACLARPGAERLDPAAADALVALLARPLAEAPVAVPPDAPAGVERMIALMLREHLGVTLRSGTPL
ncbi:MAG: DNA repair protein RecO [Miltoncostaeaceae bacterium]